MVLLKKFLMALAITLYAIVPVFAGDNYQARGHWQGHGAKMGNFKAHQQPAWEHLKKTRLRGMRASARDLRLTNKRRWIAFQDSTGKAGLISRYKRAYQIAIGRSLTPDQRSLVGSPSHRFSMGRRKGSELHWDKGDGKGWGKGCDQGWGKGYGKNSNKRYGMGGNKGAGKRRGQSYGDQWQKNRKKKSINLEGE